MTAFAYHLTYEFRTGVRDRSLLLLNYLFPLFFYLMASAMLVNLNPAMRETLIPAMVFFAVLTSTLLGMPAPIINAREAGIFRSYKIHGIPEFSILVIPALTTLFHLLIVTTIIVISAPILFGAVMPANWLGFMVAFGLLALTCTALGLLIGVAAPNSRATIFIGQSIFLPSMLIGGLMFPTQLLPDALAKLSLLLPTTHAMNIYNVFARGLPYDLNPYLSVGVLYFGAAIAFGLAIYLFNWDSQNGTQRGRPTLALLAVIPFAVAVIASITGMAAPHEGMAFSANCNNRTNSNISRCEISLDPLIGSWSKSVNVAYIADSRDVLPISLTVSVQEGTVNVSYIDENGGPVTYAVSPDTPLTQAGFGQVVNNEVIVTFTSSPIVARGVTATVEVDGQSE